MIHYRINFSILILRLIDCCDGVLYRDRSGGSLWSEIDGAGLFDGGVSGCSAGAAALAAGAHHHVHAAAAQRRGVQRPPSRHPH